MSTEHSLGASEVIPSINDEFVLEVGAVAAGPLSYGFGVAEYTQGNKSIEMDQGPNGYVKQGMPKPPPLPPGPRKKDL